jgi:hypothetical protein
MPQIMPAGRKWPANICSFSVIQSNCGPRRIFFPSWGLRIIHSLQCGPRINIILRSFLYAMSQWNECELCPDNSKWVMAVCKMLVKLTTDVFNGRCSLSFGHNLFWLIDMQWRLQTFWQHLKSGANLTKVVLGFTVI